MEAYHNCAAILENKEDTAVDIALEAGHDDDEQSPGVMILNDGG
jgi:hypothetical protein